jgi:predicted oxidoreductase
MGKDLSKLPESIRKTAALLKQYATARGVPEEAVELAWLLKHPAKIVPVTGTTKPDRLAACVQSLDVSLSREEWYRLFETARGRPMP